VERLTQLQQWIARLYPGRAFSLAPASADASFRRYFRVHFDERSVIAMDAPPSHEDCAPFIHVDKLFLAAGVHVPEILAENLRDGFLLLSDLGRETYLQVLQPTNADYLYIQAIDSLIKIQLASRGGELPDYDKALLTRELKLFPDWYLAKWRKRELNSRQAATLDQMFALVLDNNLAQPKVYVHRDYHSRNLMVSDPNPGILDFQDAVYGPITYDLVSLFKDAYISWDEELILDWVIRYWEKARVAGLPVHRDFTDFYRDFEFMGVQRHLKVLGIFARLYFRDGKDGYLKDLPLVMRYLRRACERYRELNPLARLLDEFEDEPTLSFGYTF
jgi:aminoglycoside/choline kinase family phosphotransferase